jgi:transcriptional regulator with XRE-family HTH domain
MCAIENFAENLRRACEVNKLTQRKVAKLSGIHHVTVNRILNGTFRNPTMDTCHKLSLAAGLDPDYCFDPKYCYLAG